MRVLIVDDYKDQADSLAMVVRLSGHEARVVYSCESALALISNWTPDAVLLDIGLPAVSDGLAFAKTLRETATLNDTLLVAISGYHQPEVLEESLKLGIHYYLIKPVEFELLDILLTKQSCDQVDLIP